MADIDSNLPVKDTADGTSGATAPTIVQQVGGKDGSGNLQPFKIDAQGGAIVAGEGVAGTPAGGVISIQGVTSGTPIPISGSVTVSSVTANQGTANTVSNGWPIKLTDGTSTTAVKAASTAALAVDPSAVVALSPNSPLPTGTNNIGSITNVTGTISLPTGASTSALQTTGNASLTSIDSKIPALGQALAAASIPVVLTAAQLTTLTPLTTVTVTQATGTNLHTVVDSGTIAATQLGTWTVQPGNTANTTPWLTTDTADGPVTPGTVATRSGLIGGQYNSTLSTLTTGQQAAIQIDSSGRLLTNSGVIDQSTFTYGTTIQQVQGGVYQDTSPTLTAGQQGAIRFTQTRGQHTNLRNAAGVEITSDSPGTAGNQRIHSATPDTTTATTALGALNATVSITMAGLSSAGFQLLAGTLIGTLVAESSVDGGTTWVIVTFYDPSNSSVLNSVVFGSANALKVLSVLPVGGSSNIRVRVSAYTSGTANSLLRASNVSAAAGAITSAAFTTVVTTYPAITVVASQIIGANTNRKYLQIVNNGNQSIHCQFASGTGLTATTGFAIASGTFFELKGDNLYTGPVFCLGSGTTAVTISEGTP